MPISLQPPPDVSLLSGGAELLGRVAPLWAEQRRFHADLSVQWRASILASEFEARARYFQAKAGGDRLLVLLASTADGTDVGYCVSTLTDDGKGEVDTFFVAEACRGRGIGRALFARSIDWLTSRGAERIVVEVLAENDAARRFYESAGFRLRTLTLQRVSEGSP